MGALNIESLQRRLFTLGRRTTTTLGRAPEQDRYIITVKCPPDVIIEADGKRIPVLLVGPEHPAALAFEKALRGEIPVTEDHELPKKKG